jgi:hypothetical protein
LDARCRRGSSRLPPPFYSSFATPYSPATVFHADEFLYHYVSFALD